MYKILAFTLFFVFVAMLRAEAIECPAKPAGEVNIIWSSDAVQYDFTKSQAQMNAMDSDTINPYGRNVKTHVGGLMRGGIEMKTNIQVASLVYSQSRVTCQWIDKMDITIAIDPTIYIAREYTKGSCKNRTILEHEMKHVFVDRSVVKKYAPLIKSHLQQAILKVGIVGPKPESRREDYRKKISDYMEAQLKAITDKMYAERRALQQQVDSKQEYDRVSSLCRD